MKKLLPLIAVGVCVASWASPGNVKTNVTLMADWDTNLVSSDLSFNLYGSSNIAVPMANWTLLTNVTYPACMTNDTNILIVLPITPGQHYYFLTASNWFGESFPSNTTNALIVGKINNLKNQPWTVIMKKLFTLASVGFCAWLIIIAVQAADGTYTSVNGVTTIGNATLPGNALTNFQSIATVLTNTLSVSNTTFSTGIQITPAGVVNVSGAITAGGNVTAANVAVSTAGNSLGLAGAGSQPFFYADSGGLGGTVHLRGNGGLDFQANSGSVALNIPLSWKGYGSMSPNSSTNLVITGFTNIVSGGGVIATNGLTSFASDATVALTATGITNALGKDATAYVTATAIAFTIKNAAQTTLYTSPTLTATLMVHLQSGWSVNAASGLAGTLIAN